MISIGLELNGKPIDFSKVGALERAVAEQVVSRARQMVESKLTADELSQVTITMRGERLDDLSLSVRGPEAILAKLRQPPV